MWICVSVCEYLVIWRYKTTVHELNNCTTYRPITTELSHVVLQIYRFPSNGFTETLTRNLWVWFVLKSVWPHWSDTYSTTKQKNGTALPTHRLRFALSLPQERANWTVLVEPSHSLNQRWKKINYNYLPTNFPERYSDLWRNMGNETNGAWNTSQKVKYAIHQSSCVDNINMDLTEFNSLAVVNVVMNLRNSSKMGNFINRLSNCQLLKVDPTSCS
jgi:hypothetical protein